MYSPLDDQGKIDQWKIIERNEVTVKEIDCAKKVAKETTKYKTDQFAIAFFYSY